MAAENKVKVITADQEKYKFKKLELEGDRLTGITKPRSATAKKLADLPSETEGKFVQFDLSEVAIEEIKLRNNTLSTIINIAIPLVAVYAALLTLYVAFVPPSY